MLTVQIISTVGVCYRIEVSQIEFVRICPYRQHEFTTIDPDQIHCCESHRVMHWRERQPVTPRVNTIFSIAR